MHDTKEKILDKTYRPFINFFSSSYGKSYQRPNALTEEHSDLKNVIERLRRDAKICCKELPNTISVEPVAIESSVSDRKYTNPMRWRIRMLQDETAHFDLIFPRTYPRNPPAIGTVVTNNHCILLYSENQWDESTTARDVIMDIYSRISESGKRCFSDFAVLPFTSYREYMIPEDLSDREPSINYIKSGLCWGPWRSGMIEYSKVLCIECFVCKAQNETYTGEMQDSTKLVGNVRNVYPEAQVVNCAAADEYCGVQWVWKCQVRCTSCRCKMIERYDAYKRLQIERDAEWLQMKRIMEESCGLCQMCGIASIKYFFVVLVASRVRGVCDNKKCLSRQRSVFDVVSLDNVITEQARLRALADMKQREAEGDEMFFTVDDNSFLTNAVDENEASSLLKRMRRVRRSKINLSDIAVGPNDVGNAKTRLTPVPSSSWTKNPIRMPHLTELDYIFRTIPRSSGIVRCFLRVKQRALFNRYELYLDDGQYDPHWSAHRSHRSNNQTCCDEYSGSYGNALLQVRAAELRRTGIHACYTFILCTERIGLPRLPQFLWRQVVQFSLYVPPPGRLLLIAEEGIKKIVISSGEKKLLNGQSQKSKPIGTLEFKHFLGQAQPNLKRGTMKSVLYQGTEPRGCTIFPCDDRDSNFAVGETVARRECASIWWTWNRLALPGARPNEGEICIPAQNDLQTEISKNLFLHPETRAQSTEAAHSSRNFKGKIPLVTRRPVWDSALRGYVMTFQPAGRVTKASEGNFQLVSPVALQNGDQPTQENILLQCGRYGAEENRWHVDFQYPLSIYQAFAICISNHGISDV